MWFWKRLIRLFKWDADAHNAVKDWNRWHIFKIGETERLKEYLIRQIKSANKWVLIIDPYIDETTFELIKNKKYWVKGEIRYEVKKTLKALWENTARLSNILKLKKDPMDKDIRVRTVQNLHDRYLVIDNVVWSVSNSMNSSLGSRVTNVQRLNNHMREILEAYGNYYDEKVYRK